MGGFRTASLVFLQGATAGPQREMESGDIHVSSKGNEWSLLQKYKQKLRFPPQGILLCTEREEDAVRAG